MASLNEEGRRRRGPFGLANYSKKCIQIEVQLYAVITAVNKARRRSTAQTTKLLSPLRDLERPTQSRRLHQASVVVEVVFIVGVSRDEKCLSASEREARERSMEDN